MHLIRSLFLHLVLIGLIVLALFYGPKDSVQQSKFALESISSSDHENKSPTAHPVVDTGLKAEVVSEAKMSGSSGDASEIQRYLNEISNRINRIKKYPEEARLNEQEGVVEALLEIAPNGVVLSSELIKSTPFESLNRAALQAIQKVGVLPPTPENQPIKIHIPIQFQIQ